MSQPVLEQQARAKATASSPSKPPGTQSVAEMRTLIGFSAGHFRAHASNTSSGNLARRAQRAAVGVGPRIRDRRQERTTGRYPCAQWSSSTSNPASTHPRTVEDELLAHGVHVAARHLPRHLVAAAVMRAATVRFTGQLPSGSGSSIPSHMSFVEPFRPECPICAPIAHPAVRVGETRRFASTRATCSSLYMPAQPGVIRPPGETQIILGHHEAGAAERARAEVHEVEVSGRAVERGVHVPSARRPPGWGSSARAARTAGTSRSRRGSQAAAGEIGVDLVDEAGVPQRQVLVGDPPGSGEAG